MLRSRRIPRRTGLPAGHHSMPQTLPIRHGFRRWPPWGSNTGLQPRTSSSTSAQQDHRRGEVPERSNGAVSKTVDPLRGPRVRIPVSPPLALAKSFSRSGCGRIFSLFSRVMRERLSTGPGARMGGSGLSGPIFSRADDYANLVRNATYLF